MMMDMRGWYDKEGNRVSILEAEKLLASKTYKHVGATTLPDGKWVSTVWLGFDHNFGSGPPLIFETMVFPQKGEWGELVCERYSTEDEARAGHERLVNEWSCRIKRG